MKTRPSSRRCPRDLGQRRMPVVVRRPAEARPVAASRPPRRHRLRRRTATTDENEGRSSQLSHAPAMVRLPRKAGKRAGPSTSQRTSASPTRAAYGASSTVLRPLPGELPDRPVADRSGQEIARSSELVLPRDRPEPGRERRRSLVRPVLGLGARRRGRSARPDPRAGRPRAGSPSPRRRTARSRRRSGRRRRGARAPAGRSPACRARRGRRSSWRPGRPAAAAATRSRPPPGASRRTRAGRGSGRGTAARGRSARQGRPAPPGSHARSSRAARAGALEPRRAVRAGGGEHRAGDVEDEERLDVGARLAAVVAAEHGLRGREPERTAGARRGAAARRDRAGCAGSPIAAAARDGPRPGEHEGGEREHRREARERAERGEEGQLEASTQYPRPGRPAPAPRRPPPRGPEPCPAPVARAGRPQPPHHQLEVELGRDVAVVEPDGGLEEARG